MLRSIFSAIKSALGRLFGGPFAFLWELVLMPARLADRVIGGGVPAPPIGDGPNARALKDAIASEVSMATNHDKVSRAVLTWAADSILADRPAPVPLWLPRDVKSWLPGLSRTECETLISSDKPAISAHVRNIYQLKGVRRVQPLQAETWPPVPLYVEPTPGFAHYAASLPPRPIKTRRRAA
ncbi:hypothetical protein [Bradyrhizobium sp. WSM1253]|uniref:hypothetical protein n=1 Tax=Bradyrhizobium sp. WSM1253 TaxID=319003 RepID=UPI00025D2E2E|nr:hypothetical protein [Bradyrhizobium sp. WSM1253]EIG62903.1 hypothetical protein Bra1253DRAFT_07847 [Bradyrhizobium sp. WSM1253]